MSTIITAQQTKKTRLSWYRKGHSLTPWTAAAMCFRDVSNLSVRPCVRACVRPEAISPTGSPSTSVVYYTARTYLSLPFTNLHHPCLVLGGSDSHFPCDLSPCFVQPCLRLTILSQKPGSETRIKPTTEWQFGFGSTAISNSWFKTETERERDVGLYTG